MPMTLMNYVTNKAGAWASSKQASNDNVIELTQADDAVTIQGPLSLNVSFVAEAVFSPVSGNGGTARSSTKDLYSYNLEVPAGYTWRYQISDSPVATRLMSGYKVIIRQSPCSRAPATQAPDLPCDFAVGNQPCIGEFFPVGCEPCGTGPVRMPPAACGPSLAVIPASGGCIRPRFFNGMFITREDLETELRYLRIKNKLERKALGQGVVWGLGLGCNGRSIVVKPGYAIDCCGNDLTVTSNYTVDPQTLLSDPAICNLLSQGQQRFNLLLEYVECPEQPRPVHGDPCVGSASACEMSRVRETVRLRLVPPRDYKPNGPITKFLNTIATAAGSSAGSMSSGTTAGSVTTSLPNAPFSMSMFISSTGSTLAFSTIPTTSAGTTSTAPISLPSSTTNVVLVPSSGFSFSSGVVTLTINETALGGNPTVLGPTTVVDMSTSTGSITQWPITLPTRELLDGSWTATFVANWTGSQPTATGTAQVQGTTTLTLTTSKGGATGGSPFIISGTVTATASSTVAITPFPCLTDPCCPAGTKPLFPVTPPWADANPFIPGQAADLTVLEMAFIYALAVGQWAQGSISPGSLPGYYFAAAGALDPSIFSSQNEEEAFVIATQQLLSDWCCSLLYPGPSCEGDPHGVVIGCATVNSDGITHIDSWSGRRWVVTYPLLSYWGQQFGIVPLDLLASKLFSVLCCLAGLGASLLGNTGDTRTGTDTTIREVPLGAGILRVVPQPAPKLQDRVSQPPMRTQSASLTTFTAKVLAALARSPAPVGTPMVDVTLAGYPDVHLIVPDDTATPAPTPTPDRTTSLVRDALAVRELRTAIPPLLRGFAESLAAGLTSAVPVSAMTPAQPIVAPLTTAGIKTVGDVLSRTPDAIYVSVLGKTQAPAVSELVTRAEATAETIAKNVVDALKQAAGARTLVSTDDLASADARKAFVQALATQTKLPEGTVEASVTAALK